MSKLAVVYWTGTGNTEQMAAEVAAGTARVTADGQTRQAETGPGVLTVTHEGTTLLCERFEWK